MGNLYIIIAPSGAGKTSLVEQLLVQNTNLYVSISHTTRPARKNEQNGHPREENFGQKSPIARLHGIKTESELLRRLHGLLRAPFLQIRGLYPGGLGRPGGGGSCGNEQADRWG